MKLRSSDLGALSDMGVGCRAGRKEITEQSACPDESYLGDIFGPSRQNGRRERGSKATDDCRLVTEDWRLEYGE